MIADLLIDKIVIENRLRKDLGDISGLKESIAEVGLLNPITVRKTESGYKLCAGERRLTSCKQLGFDKVACNVVELDDLKAELVEIDENIKRKDLTAFEEAMQLNRRKEIYETLYPETANGKTPGNQHTGQKREKDTVSFSRNAANSTGQSDRSIRRKTSIAQNLAPLSEEITGSIIEDSQKDLIELASVVKDYGEEKAVDILNEIKAGSAPNVRKAKQRVIQIGRVPAPKVLGEYDLIYCDPPWRYDFAETTNREIENQYPTMSVEELKEMHVPSSGNCVLYMWATAPKLKEALEIMDSWGFTYKTHGVWDKEIIGMGYWFRGQHELLLVGVKGKVSPPKQEVRISSVIKEKRTKHSKKPQKLYEILEQLFPEKTKIELFARNKREGWANWGNEKI